MKTEEKNTRTKLADLRPEMPIFILNVNGLNISIKRKMLAV
jgi:hypothetical protein